MRLWSVRPSLLDRAALVACWREALLAQQVLAGLTRGYTRHPQLERFRDAADPIPVTEGQVAFEVDHLLAKVRVRDPAWAARLPGSVTGGVQVHPLFVVVPGGVADWERAVGPADVRRSSAAG